ncbi:hypothetical protein [Novosphingobium sp.]|uniref:hypothetical protein n=1 Tax=Novosphingobium sp. TaxID=1874826 RepID=UPI0035B0E13E
MATLIMTDEVWETDVTVALTTHTRHHHVPSPVSPTFAAPAPAARLTFGPVALAAAVARTATTRPGRPRLLSGLQRSALAQLECLVSNNTAFELTEDFSDLADTERTLIAARCGAGITDLYMNALGYVWRANAACLSDALDPHADFLYDGGNASGLGVVLAEAHGSFAASATGKSVAAAARRKYARQVKPHVDTPSPFGHVIHGYSIAFGSQPGSVGAFLSVAETRIPKAKKPPVSPPSKTAGPAGRRPDDGGPIELFAHRSNFLLMGAGKVVDWIDWLIGAAEVPEDLAPARFLRFRYGGLTFLGVEVSIWPSWLRHLFGDIYWEDPTFWRPSIRREVLRRYLGGDYGWFVIEEKAGLSFLDGLTGMIRAGDTRRVPLELPTLEPIGFDLEGGRELRRTIERPGYDFALFRDGLALLRHPFRPGPIDIVTWSPKEGLG